MRVEAELKDQIRNLTALLESSQPNLKAFEKFEEIDAKVREQVRAGYRLIAPQPFCACRFSLRLPPLVGVPF